MYLPLNHLLRGQNRDRSSDCRFKRCRRIIYPTVRVYIKIKPLSRYYNEILNQFQKLAKTRNYIVPLSCTFIHSSRSDTFISSYKARRCLFPGRTVQTLPHARKERVSGAL